MLIGPPIKSIGVELKTNGNISTKNITSNGANITAESNNGTVETGTLNASFVTGTGGKITLIAPGAVTSKDLIATGIDGGNVTVKSGDRITTGNIDVSATLGKGGKVLLDPPNDIQVGYIKAEGGSQGTGGTVDITTARFFRATGTFRDRNIGYDVEFLQSAESEKRWLFHVRHAKTWWNMPTSAPGPNGTGNTGFVEHVTGGLVGEDYQGVGLGGQCELS